jgi:hypothetical protein
MFKDFVFTEPKGSSSITKSPRYILKQVYKSEINSCMKHVTRAMLVMRWPSVYMMSSLLQYPALWKNQILMRNTKLEFIFFTTSPIIICVVC